MINQTNKSISLSAVQPGKPLLLLISHLDDLDLSSFTYGSFQRGFLSTNVSQRSSRDLDNSIQAYTSFPRDQ